MNCEYCDSPLAYEITECPHCGAPCKFVHRPTEAELVNKQKADMRDAYQKKKAQDAKNNNKELINMSDIDIGFLEENRKSDERTAKISSIVLGVIVALVFILILCSC